MKFRFLLFFIFGLSFLFSNAQNNSPEGVEIRIRNSSLLPKRITVISYQPGDSGNSTSGIFLLPGFSRKFTFEVGTKVYLANADQIGQVMGGNRIDGEKPFIVVDKASNGKTFDI
jgi:hypothetical protein